MPREPREDVLGSGLSGNGLAGRVSVTAESGVKVGKEDAIEIPTEGETVLDSPNGGAGGEVLDVCRELREG